MGNKEIQEKRMKEYFIQAAKSILKGEGLRSLSVRNIADQAGYSYATLYNYFKDVNDLIFFCVEDFQEECAAFVASQTQNMPDGKEKLKATIIGYVGYFVEYPGIFDLFYLAMVGDFGSKKATIDLIGTSLDQVCEKDWNFCTTKGIFAPEKAEVMKSQLRLMVVGLLLFYLNRRKPESYADFMNEARVQIDYILG